MSERTRYSCGVRVQSEPERGEMGVVIRNHPICCGEAERV